MVFGTIGIPERLLGFLPPVPPGWLGSHFARCQHPANHGGIQFVLPLGDIAGIVLDPQDENRQEALFVEALFADGDRQDGVQAVFPVSSLVAVFARVPGEHPHLVIVIGLPIVGLGQQA